MQGAGNPAWTEQPQTVSEQNMLGAETLRNRRLLTGLLYPLLSNAITLRLRYLSFWLWVLNNHEHPSQSERSLYEKLFLFSMLAHDCPDDDVLATNGRVGAERSVDAERNVSDLYDQDAERIDISSEAFMLADGNRCGFDLYYQRPLNRLFLLRGERTLTPTGRTVAEAFDEAVDIEFDELRSAVAAEEVSTDLINRLAPTGCACQISGREKQLLMQAYLAMFEADEDYTTLSFVDELDLDALSTPKNLLGDDGAQLRSSRTTEEIAIEKLLTEDERDDQSDISEYVARGFGIRMRGSGVLFLATAGWTTDPAPTEDGEFEELEGIRSLWRLFVHTEYFIYGCEALLCAVVRVVRGAGPISRATVLDQLFDSEQYTRTLRSILGGGVSIEKTDDNPNRLREVRNALYYGTWMNTGRDISYEPLDGVRSDQLTWRALYNGLEVGGTAAQFNLGTQSEEAMKSLCFQYRDGGDDLKRAAQLAAYVTILFARLRQRHVSYFGTKAYEPQRAWFRALETQPSPSLVWSTLPDPDSGSPMDVAATMRSLTDRWIIDQYWTVSHEKIRRSPSRATRHIEREMDRRYRFGTAYRSFAQSNLKFDRLTDLYYELGLTTSPRMDSFAPSERGETFLKQVGVSR